MGSRVPVWVQFLEDSKKVHLRGVFRILSNIQVGAFCEYNQWLKVVTYFREKLNLRCLTGFWIRLYIQFEIKFRRSYERKACSKEDMFDWTEIGKTNSERYICLSIYSDPEGYIFLSVHVMTYMLWHFSISTAHYFWERGLGNKYSEICSQSHWKKLLKNSKVGIIWAFNFISTLVRTGHETLHIIELRLTSATLIE